MLELFRGYRYRERSRKMSKGRSAKIADTTESKRATAPHRSLSTPGVDQHAIWFLHPNRRLLPKGKRDGAATVPTGSALPSATAHGAGHGLLRFSALPRDRASVALSWGSPTLFVCELLCWMARGT